MQAAKLLTKGYRARAVVGPIRGGDQSTASTLQGVAAANKRVLCSRHALSVQHREGTTGNF